MLPLRTPIILSTLALAAPLAAQTASAASSPAAPAPAEQQTQSDWRETWAYQVGMQAVVYGYPVVKNLTVRHGMIERSTGQADMPLNTWFHSRRASDHTDKVHSSVTPDLLYSALWFDLRKGPIVISVPDGGGTYYSLQFMEMYSDIFAYLGSRATGGRAGKYLLAEQDWKGEIPDGIAGVLHSPSPTGLILLRVGFADRTRLELAHALQDKVTVEGIGGAALDHGRDVLDPVAPGTSPLPFFAMLNRGMTENPPPAKDAALIAQFRSVGIGAGMPDDFAALDPATRKGLARAMGDGLAFLRQVSIAGGNAKKINGWAYGQADWGRTASSNDFLTRSANQSFSGMQEHWIEEVVKLRAHHDGDGELLDGSKHTYTLTFQPSEIPVARAFWSVTVYNGEYDLVENPLSRFALGSHDTAMKRNKDGSLTLYIQADPPAKKLMPNWLPVPKAQFNLFLRAYLPDVAMQQQSYAPPPVRKVP